MASRSIGSIYASLTLRDGGFRRGLQSANKALGEFGSMAIKAAAGGAVALGAALAAGTIRTLDQVDSLGDLAAQTGVSIGSMMKLQRAYKDGGRAAEMAGTDIGKMQKAIVGAASGGSDPFKAIGLSAQNLLKMDPAAQFDTIGEAIMRISNPAERTAKAMEIFGKGGMGLMTVFEGLPAAVTALGRMPEVAQEFGARMGEANDLIGHLPLKSDQFFMGFTAGIVDTLLPGLNMVNEFDFTTLGQNLGNVLTNAIKEASEIMNIAWDVFNGRDSQGSSHGGPNKYKEAQIALDLEDLVARKMKEVDRINELKKNPIKDLSANKLAESITTKTAAAPEAAKMNVDAYQRRGGMLSGIATSPKEDKQINLLTEMRDVLKRIAVKGGIDTW